MIGSDSDMYAPNYGYPRWMYLTFCTVLFVLMGLAIAGEFGFGPFPWRG